MLVSAYIINLVLSFAQNNPLMIFISQSVRIWVDLELIL